MNISILTLTNANGEYSKQLGSNCIGVILHCRTGVAFQVAVASGQVGSSPGNCITVPDNAALTTLPISAYTAIKGATLYFASSTAGAVIEIWQFFQD